MGIYLLRKIRDMMITLLILVIIVFLMFYVIPGNPARIMLGMNAPADKVARLEEELGINEPLPARFATYLGKLLSGDPGHSVRFDRPVIDLIKERLPMTLTLALFAFLLVLLLAIPLGLLAARRPGGFWTAPSMSSPRRTWRYRLFSWRSCCGYVRRRSARL